MFRLPQIVADSSHTARRDRDATEYLCRVGSGGVNWGITLKLRHTPDQATRINEVQRPGDNARGGGDV